jgi:hypothetical protein
MRLHAIDRTDRGGKRLSAALHIYRETILPEAQNPERQILYWIDHSKDEKADEFRCFSIETGQKVIGYLQFSYFSEENVIFLEYLCVRDKDKNGIRHSRAIDAIRDYVSSTFPPGVTVVFEVAKQKAPGGRWESDEKLKSYFLWLGFRSVAFDYHYPVLQSYDGAISYPADLMVRLPEGRTTMSACELRTVLRCIYFKHYLRWDRPFLGDGMFKERERLINDLYSKQIKRIGKADLFSTDGIQKRLLVLEPRRILPKIGPLLSKVFGPKLPRLIGAAAAVYGLQAVVGSSWALIPFVFLVLVIYCVSEDTASSRKLLLVLARRFSTSPPRR